MRLPKSMLMLDSTIGTNVVMATWHTTALRIHTPSTVLRLAKHDNCPQASVRRLLSYFSRGIFADCARQGSAISHRKGLRRSSRVTGMQLMK